MLTKTLLSRNLADKLSELISPVNQIGESDFIISIPEQIREFIMCLAVQSDPV